MILSRTGDPRQCLHRTRPSRKDILVLKCYKKLVNENYKEPINDNFDGCAKDIPAIQIKMIARFSIPCLKINVSSQQEMQNGKPVNQ